MNPEIIWSKYRALELWKRILLVIPVIIAIVLTFFYFSLKQNDGLANQMFDDYSEQTDDTIKVTQEKINELLQEYETIEQERENIKEELKDNEKFANDIDTRIDSANSLDELEGIRQEIADRVNDNPE